MAGFVLVLLWLCEWLGESTLENDDASSLGALREWSCTTVLVVGHLLLPSHELDYMSVGNILLMEHILINRQLQRFFQLPSCQRHKLQQCYCFESFGIGLLPH